MFDPDEIAEAKKIIFWIWHLANKFSRGGIQAVQEGRDPQHVVRDAAANRFNHIVVFSEAIPMSTDWKEYTRSRETK